MRLRLIFVGLALAGLAGPAASKNVHLFGVTGQYKLASSYYSFQGTSLTDASRRRTLANGLGAGVFADWRFAVFSGVKLDLVLYPNWRTRDDLINSTFQDLMAEAGVLAKIYFPAARTPGQIFWLGYGPSLQYIVSRGFDNYVLNFNLAFAGRLRIHPRLYLLPEIVLGTNLFLKTGAFADVVSRTTQTTDFFRNGFTIALNCGAGMPRLFHWRRP